MPTSENLTTIIIAANPTRGLPRMEVTGTADDLIWFQNVYSPKLSATGLRSSAYEGFLRLYQTGQGVVVNFQDSPIDPRSGDSHYPSGYSVFSSYGNGSENVAGDADVTLNIFRPNRATGSVADWSYSDDMQEEVITHEILHSKYGAHEWAGTRNLPTVGQILGDQVYIAEMKEGFINNTPVIIYDDNGYVSEIRYPHEQNRSMTEAEYNNYFAKMMVEAYKYQLETNNGGNLNRPPNITVPEIQALIDRNLRRNEFIGAVGQIGSIFGSSLGNYLAGTNKIAGVVYSSVLGEIGERLGGLIAGATNDFNIPQALKLDANGNPIKPSFTDDVFARMTGAAVGTVSSILASQLSQALGLDGFGGELFTTVASTGTNAVINTIIVNAGTPATGTLHKDLFDGVFEGKNFTSGSVWGGAIGAFIGTKLAYLLIKPETEAAVVLSSVGGAVGAYVGLGVVAGSFSTASISALSFSQALIASGVGAFVGVCTGGVGRELVRS